MPLARNQFILGNYYLFEILGQKAGNPLYKQLVNSVAYRHNCWKLKNQRLIIKQ